MKKTLLIAALAAVAYFTLQSGPGTPDLPPDRARSGVASGTGVSTDHTIEYAYANRLGNYQVAGQGVVTRVLPDDNAGSRHQRFIVRLDSGRTLLVSHNIDLAKRIDSLRAGDRIAFYGEYEWNAKGGVVHWTHHDPQGRHPDGWLKHDGQVYR